MPQPTFFLGLGGQKCGSTWYHDYLARQEGSDFGRLGEYQVWESDLAGPFARYRVPEPATAAKLRAEAKRHLGLPIPAHYLRWRFQTNRDEYFTYFARLLARPGVLRTGDVTPSYAALPAPMLRGIRNGFASRGITVKAIFAMRDPVARIRSHLRMDQEKGRAAATGDEAADLACFFAGAEAAARSRYDMTLDALDAAFSPDDVHVCLFEELFEFEGIKRFAAFAGVGIEPDAGGRAVNARAGTSARLPEDLVRRIALHYKPVYQAAASRFPQILTLWPSAAQVL